MPEPTPTRRQCALEPGGFPTLLDALDYAAEAGTGMNFYDGRGELAEPLPYRALRDRASALGERLAALELPRGSHVAMAAETHADFMVAFFAARHAALVPVPLPAIVNLGGHRQFVDLLRRLIANADVRAALASEAFQPYLEEATKDAGLLFAGSVAEALALPPGGLPERPGPDDIAYLQYTSGSTRFPRGAMLTERAALNNVAAIIADGLALEETDRFCSWLPLYHDMGLIGKMVVPIASQSSVDYLGTREFAMRPRLWLKLIDRNRATVSFSPPFGYELVARRLRNAEPGAMELSCWRIAGVGADMIRPETLERFNHALTPCGFRPESLTPSYGMAEVGLAISFTPPGRGVEIDHVDFVRYESEGRAEPPEDDGERRGRFVRCGVPLPGYEVEIRDEQGRALGERRVGTLHVRCPSLMSGYYREPEASAEVLVDGWLDTGDLGYRVGETVVITGRRKDLMIINGRNIWPQDIEFVAEQRAAIRPGDAAAFSVPDEADGDALVLLIQCREPDPERQDILVRGIRGEIQAEFGVDCHIELIAPHSLPRTTSGKLSRTKAREDWLADRLEPAAAAPAAGG